VPSRLTTVLVASAIGVSALSATVVAVPALAATVQGDSPKDAVTDRVAAIRDRLQGLVDDKTLTDAQADKVAETLGEKGGPLGRDGFHGPRMFLGGHSLAPAAQFLGMSEDDVRSALRDGTTLAELARQKGKSVDGLVAAITKAVNGNLDQAVKDGKLTQQQADEARQRVADGVKRFVEQGFPAKGGGRGFGGHGFGPRGDRDNDRPDAPPAPSSPAPSSTASSSSFNA
jgi:hypothetical protein